ncbi:predicted protein [Thalassiosira pseudonana CCMP1335]|uniref:Uncharacterized protein n=1 Tax=Thalassiosira pseudonana TaxID=35128 RepID=B8BT77_THAPS|nr:predicted protein [Thalassiosira pseudonana CCMP1335]EED95671.1 predicted protein [Thalassiosira pseudonana CCMP1335]
MSNSVVWGGPIELTVAAILFRRRIEVYKLDGDAFEHTYTHGNNEAIDPPILSLYDGSQALEALTIRKTTRKLIAPSAIVLIEGCAQHWKYYQAFPSLLKVRSCYSPRQRHSLDLAPRASPVPLSLNGYGRVVASASLIPPRFVKGNIANEVSSLQDNMRLI